MSSRNELLLVNIGRGRTVHQVRARTQRTANGLSSLVFEAPRCRVAGIKDSLHRLRERHPSRKYQSDPQTNKPPRCEPFYFFSAFCSPSWALRLLWSRRKITTSFLQPTADSLNLQSRSGRQINSAMSASAHRYSRTALKRQGWPLAQHTTALHGEIQMMRECEEIILMAC